MNSTLRDRSIGENDKLFEVDLVDNPSPAAINGMKKFPSIMDSQLKEINEKDDVRRGLTVNPHEATALFDTQQSNPATIKDYAEEKRKRKKMYQQSIPEVDSRGNSSTKQLAEQMMEYSRSESSFEDTVGLVRQKAIKQTDKKRKQSALENDGETQFLQIKGKKVAVDSGGKSTDLVSKALGKFLLHEFRGDTNMSSSDEDGRGNDEADLDQGAESSRNSSYFSSLNTEEEEFDKISRNSKRSKLSRAITMKSKPGQNREPKSPIDFLRKPSNVESHSSKSDRDVRSKKGRDDGEIKVKQKLKEKLVVSKSSWQYKIWNIYTYFINFYYAVYVAYYVSFYRRLSEDSYDFFHSWNLYFHVIFILELIVWFLVEEEHLTSRYIERDIKKLFQMKLKHPQTKVDIFTILPLPPLFRFSEATYRIAYCIKIYRIRKGFPLFSPQNFKWLLKYLQNLVIQRKIKQAEAYGVDPNSGDGVVNLSLVMLVTKIQGASSLVFLLLGLSFFLGQIWHFLSDMFSSLESENNFNKDFGMDERSNGDILIALTYFMFTSLSTVGLGDLHPRNSWERMVAVPMLLFGVMITSMLQDHLSKMILQIQSFDRGYEDSDDLNLFFGTLKRINNNKQLQSNMTQKMEQYFDFRWEHDKNLALQDPEEVIMYERLPHREQRLLFTEYFYQEFVQVYNKILNVESELKSLQFKRLKLRKLNTPMKAVSAAPGSWENEEYQYFVVFFLKSLEPKYLSKNVIQKQNTWIDEMVFITEGEFEVGYNHEYFLIKHGLGHPMDRINQMDDADFDMPKPKSSQIKKLHFPLKFKAGQPIGMFEMMFEQRSQYIYRLDNDSRTKNNFFFIRKRHWKEISERRGVASDVIHAFTSRALLHYIDRIYLPIKQYQDNLLELKRKEEEEKKRAKEPLAAAARKMRIIALLRGKNAFQSTKSVTKELPKMNKQGSKDDDNTRSINFEESHSLTSIDEDEIPLRVVIDDLVQRVALSELTRPQRNIFKSVIPCQMEATLMQQLDDSYNVIEDRLASLEGLFEKFMHKFDGFCMEKYTLEAENLQLRSELALFKEGDRIFNNQGESSGKTEGSPAELQLGSKRRETANFPVGDGSPAFTRHISLKISKIVEEEITRQQTMLSNLQKQQSFGFRADSVEDYVKDDLHGLKAQPTLNTNSVSQNSKQVEIHNLVDKVSRQSSKITIRSALPTPDQIDEEENESTRKPISEDDPTEANVFKSSQAPKPSKSSSLKKDLGSIENQSPFKKAPTEKEVSSSIMQGRPGKEISPEKTQVKAALITGLSPDPEATGEAQYRTNDSPSTQDVKAAVQISVAPLSLAGDAHHEQVTADENIQEERKESLAKLKMPPKPAEIEQPSQTLDDSFDKVNTLIIVNNLDTPDVKSQSRPDEEFKQEPPQKSGHRDSKSHRDHHGSHHSSHRHRHRHSHSHRDKDRDKDRDKEREDEKDRHSSKEKKKDKKDKKHKKHKKKNKHSSKHSSSSRRRSSRHHHSRSKDKDLDEKLRSEILPDSSDLQIDKQKSSSSKNLNETTKKIQIQRPSGGQMPRGSSEERPPPEKLEKVTKTPKTTVLQTGEVGGSIVDDETIPEILAVEEKSSHKASEKLQESIEDEVGDIAANSSDN